MADFATLHEIVAAARGNLSDGAWDYLTGGAETETSLLRNRLGLDSIAFRPRVLNDVSAIDLGGTIVGHATRLPVSLAPMGSLELLHPDGSMAVARAAEAFGTVSYLSSVTHPGLKAIAEHTSHPKVYQLYVRAGRDSVAEVAKRAMSAGYAAFCLTVDVALYSRRERDLIKRYVPTARRSAAGEGMEYQARLDWDLVKWFKDSFDIPLQIKGVATAEDAALCVEHGVDTVYVSNHGGRQLDHGRATIDMLPEVAEAVGGKAEIVVDGGFMRGADIVKAIARGADSVSIGKVQGFGLAAAGMSGIVRVLELLEEEMRISMGLMGLTRLDRLDATFLHPAPPVREPSVLSAFPFLTLRSPEY